MNRNTVKIDHSKFSTPPLESLWWRADITKENIGWVRKNLGRNMDGAKEFEAIPLGVWISDSPLHQDFQNRVHFREGEEAPRIQIAVGVKYDYRNEYLQAKRERDPYLSPHGMFRELENGFHQHAMEFMQKFGPLTWKVTSGRRGEEGWISLDDFWNRHARFVGVAQLWESRFDEDALRRSWRWIYERLDRINKVGPARFGAWPNWNSDRYYEFPGRFPWDLYGGIEVGLQQSHSHLLLTTHEIVHYELNLNSQECRQVWAMQSVGRDVRFEPIRSYWSLWAAIWGLFGEDICTLTHGWRVCLECGRRFYPKDHRSVCCTSKHQALWSKRKWAREHRKGGVLRRESETGTRQQ